MSKVEQEAAPPLQMVGVSLAYKDALFAVRDVNLCVHPHESVVILGPSGCGKSTILRMAAGLLAPTQGTVLQNGKPVSARAGTSALVLQDLGLLPWKTVGQNVGLGLRFKGMPYRERIISVKHCLEQVGLAGYAGALPQELSGGQRQRVAVARSLALQADLLLLDEPLSALDALAREQLQDLLRGLWSSAGYAQLMVTHAIDEAVYLGERILIMAQSPGRIVREIINFVPAAGIQRSDQAFFEQVAVVRRALEEMVNGA